MVRSPVRDESALLEGLRPHLRPLAGAAAGDPELVARLGRSRLALLGEASHGTHEFYAERVALSRELITGHGFNALVMEADWPDAWRVNRYIRGSSDDRDAEAALSGFRRFPTWMWCNTVIVEFVEWLREHNAGRPASGQVGFYGMDLYSLYGSIAAVLQYLDRVDPEAARRARSRYGCFDHYGEDSQAYGYAASFGMKATCEDEVIQQLREMNRRAGELMAAGSSEDRAEVFYAQQNARLVRNAEEYYRTMFHGRISSWNLRDSHMVETLQALEKHLAALTGCSRLIVWAHNSHLGDASATEMGDLGEWNVGQLARDRWGADALLVGFSTHHGTVTAASEWDAPAQRKRVRPGLEGSYEDLFHQAGERFWLPLAGHAALGELLRERRLQRAIGVIYLPQSERLSHYFHTRLPAQFDALIHIDETRALQPLVAEPAWHEGEPAETYPSGL